MATKTVLLTSVGAGTWTLPADLDTGTAITVTAIGGGAGGTAATNSTTGGKGGGGAAWAQSSVSLSGLTPGSSSVWVSVGTPGSAGTTSGAAGTSGAASWFNKAANSAPALSSNGALAQPGLGTGVAGDRITSVGDTKSFGGTGGVGGIAAGGGGGGGGAAGSSLNTGGALSGLGGNGATSSDGGGGGGGGVGGNGSTATTITGANGGLSFSGGAGGVGGTAPTTGSNGAGSDAFAGYSGAAPAYSGSLAKTRRKFKPAILSPFDKIVVPLDDITATMAAQEAGRDSASGIGLLSIYGRAAVREAGGDGVAVIGRRFWKYPDPSNDEMQMLVEVLFG